MHGYVPEYTECSVYIYIYCCLISVWPGSTLFPPTHFSFFLSIILISFLFNLSHLLLIHSCSLSPLDFFTAIPSRARPLDPEASTTTSAPSRHSILFHSLVAVNCFFSFNFLLLLLSLSLSLPLLRHSSPLCFDSFYSSGDSSAVLLTPASTILALFLSSTPPFISRPSPSLLDQPPYFHIFFFVIPSFTSNQRQLSIGT